MTADQTGRRGRGSGAAGDAPPPATGDAPLPAAGDQQPLAAGPPAMPGALLRRHGLHPKHSWGQNFLADESVFSKLLAALAPRPDDWVLEIGAGLGTLTGRLAGACARVIALERDRDLAAVLRAELADHPQIEVFEANALTFDYDGLACRALAGRAPALRVIGNLPYQIASPILFRLLAMRQHLGRIVLMLQREMAERLAAPPGSRTYGGLSVIGQALAEVRLWARVPAGAFLPPPRVESAIVCLDPRPALEADEDWLSRTVRAAFSGRRKQLGNALAALLPKSLVLEALVAAGIDPRQRPERIDPAGFIRLSEATRKLVASSA